MLQAGLYGQEVANATAEYGLHYRVGHASSVGLAGYTLGAPDLGNYLSQTCVSDQFDAYDGPALKAKPRQLYTFQTQL